MCCSKDTVAATGIFTPHTSRNKPFVFFFYALLFIRVYSVRPETASIVRVSPSKTGSIGFTQPKSAPQLHAASTDEVAKGKNEQRMEEPDYLQRAETFTHRQQLCGSLVVR